MYDIPSDDEKNAGYSPGSFVRYRYPIPFTKPGQVNLQKVTFYGCDPTDTVRELKKSVGGWVDPLVGKLTWTLFNDSWSIDILPSTVWSPWRCVRIVMPSIHLVLCINCPLMSSYPWGRTVPRYVGTVCPHLLKSVYLVLNVLSSHFEFMRIFPSKVIKKSTSKWGTWSQDHQIAKQVLYQPCYTSWVHEFKLNILQLDNGTHCTCPSTAGKHGSVLRMELVAHPP